MPKTPPEADQVSTDTAASDVPPVTTASTTMSPEAWAEVFFRPQPSGRMHDDAWKHASASVLHGWGAYHRRTGIPFAITSATYLAAIDAASGNTFTAHPAADCREKG
jgi:hypothetical protein